MFGWLTSRLPAVPDFAWRLLPSFAGGSDGEAAGGEHDDGAVSEADVADMCRELAPQQLGSDSPSLDKFEAWLVHTLRRVAGGGGGSGDDAAAADNRDGADGHDGAGAAGGAGAGAGAMVVQGTGSAEDSSQEDGESSSGRFHVLRLVVNKGANRGLAWHGCSSLLPPLRAHNLTRCDFVVFALLVCCWPALRSLHGVRYQNPSTILQRLIAYLRSASASKSLSFVDLISPPTLWYPSARGHNGESSIFAVSSLHLPLKSLNDHMCAVSVHSRECRGAELQGEGHPDVSASAQPHSAAHAAPQRLAAGF